jgi:hypothetical protein
MLIHLPSANHRLDELTHLPNELIYLIYNYVNPMTIMHSVTINIKLNKLLINDKFIYKQYERVKEANIVVLNLGYGDCPIGRYYNDIGDDFYLYHFDKIAWDRLTYDEYENFYKFLATNIKYFDDNDWFKLCKNVNIHHQFFDIHIDKLNKNCLSELHKNHNISQKCYNKLCALKIKKFII